MFIPKNWQMKCGSPRDTVNPISYQVLFLQVLFVAKKMWIMALITLGTSSDTV